MKKFKKSICLGLSVLILSTAITPVFAANNYKTTQLVNEILKNDNISQKEWNNYIKFVKNEISKEPTERWVGAVVKKVMKYVVKHLDVIPSKTLRKYLEKYGSKVISAIDTIDTWTWYGIANALIAVGIPDNVADAIADFIVTFIL